jgi:small-conductance mechanosensitive channel
MEKIPLDIARARNFQRFFNLLLALILSGVAALAEAQPAPSSAPEAEPATASQTAVKPAPIPLAEIATQVESVSARLRDLKTELSSDPIAATVAAELPLLTREIDARLGETRKIVAQRPSLEMLARLEADWRRIRASLSDWTRDLTSLATRLDREIGQLDALTEIWEPTLDVAKASHAPPEIVRRIESVLAAIGQTRQTVDRQRAQTWTMQNRVAVQDARIEEALAAIAQTREDVFHRLFIQDSPALWSAEVRAHAPGDLLEESRNSFATQWAALRVYAERAPARFLIHAALFIALAAGLFIARAPVRRQLRGEAAPALVFEMPVAAALILSVFFARWIYPQAPRLLWVLLIALALVPSVTILRRLINGNLRPIFYALVVFFFVDQLRALTTAVQVLPRLLFTAEMLGAIVFLLWLILAKLRRGAAPGRLHKTIMAAACAGLFVAAVALTANVVGYVTLANLLGNALLGSAYLALILYAAVEILDGLVMIALRVRPLALLRIAQRHGPLLRYRVRAVLKWLAVSLWLLGTLNRLLLRERLFRALKSVLTAEIGVGFLRITLGDVLAFGLTVWAAFLVSRLVRFLLEEDVYPRVHLTRGLPYAISTTLHYIILLVGFFVAVSALGFDMTKVTILAGAFTVGVGFGLQNIFNNFVSGLILLFERPVKIGDVVQIEDAAGTVEHIGIRASIIRTPNGSEIIVPNGKLISERLTNWTLSNHQRTIELPIAVAPGADPGHVIELLERTAAAHPLVTHEPPPRALVVKLSPDSLAFELRAWTDRIEQWMEIRSELAITISAALAAEKIAIR